MAKLPIHTGVSPAYHPAVIEHRAPMLTGRTQGAFVAAQQTLFALYHNQSLILNAREAEFAKQRTPNNLRALQMARDGKAKAPPNTVMIGGKISLTLPPSDA